MRLWTSRPMPRRSRSCTRTSRQASMLLHRSQCNLYHREHTHAVSGLKAATACRSCGGCWQICKDDRALILAGSIHFCRVWCPERCHWLQIVQRLLGEVEAASAAMLAGLLARLKGPIQLPECLRVVGCLRRLAAFPEPELRRRCAAWLLPRTNLCSWGISSSNTCAHIMA